MDEFPLAVAGSETWPDETSKAAIVLGLGEDGLNGCGPSGVETTSLLSGQLPLHRHQDRWPLGAMAFEQRSDPGRCDPKLNGGLGFGELTLADTFEHRGANCILAARGRRRIEVGELVSLVRRDQDSGAQLERGVAVAPVAASAMTDRNGEVTAAEAKLA